MNASTSYANVMALIGAIILVCVVAYYGFLGLDAWGLADQTGQATVLSKKYEPAKTGYVTQTINNRSRVIPQMTPEAYRLELQIDGTRAEAVVSRELYESINASQRVNATYQRGRLTGSMRVTGVTR